ncbi:hypothetical protein CC78DRAFT_538090, partial [Lojkania enalia]
IYFLTDISALLYASSFTVGVIAAAAPLCSETINKAGSRPPNSVVFLKNIEASFFNAGLRNLI